MENDLCVYTPDVHHHFTTHYENEKNSFVGAILEKNSHFFVSNIKTKLLVVTYKNDAWLLTINDKEYNNAMTCSPYATYIGYPKEIAEKFTQVWLKTIVYIFPRIFGFIFKLLKINKVIQVNNNLTPINYYSSAFRDNVCNLLQHLLSAYPKHILLLPHINEQFDHELISILKQCGFILIKSKETHLFDPQTEYVKHSDFKRDIKLLKKSNYQIVRHEALTKEDLDRIFVLYQKVYLYRHTLYNPHLTKEYFYYAHQYHWHYYIALRNNEGVIDAFASWMIKDNIMIATGCGYDTEKPIELGLYRMIISLSLQYAYDNKYPYNLGAGSDQFKINRGSKKILEYTAVYCKHLSFYRKLPWKILKWSTDKFIKTIHDQNGL